MAQLLSSKDVLFAIQSYPSYNGKTYVVLFRDVRNGGDNEYYITNDPVEFMTQMALKYYVVEDWEDSFESASKNDNILEFSDYFELEFANAEYCDLFYNVLLDKVNNSN